MSRPNLLSATSLIISIFLKLKYNQFSFLFYSKFNYCLSSMGNAKSFEQFQVAIPSSREEWLTETRLSYCHLVRNRNTKYLLEEYIIPTDPQMSLIKYYEISEFRRKQNLNLVKVYQVEKEPSSFLCHGQYYLRVKTQRIPVRLSEVAPLTVNQGFYVLMNSLIGYRAICQLNGPSMINDDMIGFSEDGKIRVWISANFAKNSPDNQIKLKSSDVNSEQHSMVQQIISLIKEHLQGKSFPEQFESLHSQIRVKTFESMMRIIDVYLSGHSIILPTSIKPCINSESVESLLKLKDSYSQRGIQLTKIPINTRFNQPFTICGSLNQSSDSRLSDTTNRNKAQTNIPQQNTLKQSIQLRIPKNCQKSQELHQIVKQIIKDQPLQHKSNLRQSTDSISNFTFCAQKTNQNIKSVLQSSVQSNINPNTTKPYQVINQNDNRINKISLVNSKPTQHINVIKKQLPLQGHVRQESTCPQNYTVNSRQVLVQRVNKLRQSYNQKERTSRVFYSPRPRPVQPVTQLYFSRTRSPQPFTTPKTGIKQVRISNVVRYQSPSQFNPHIKTINGAVNSAQNPSICTQTQNINMYNHFKSPSKSYLRQSAQKMDDQHQKHQKNPYLLQSPRLLLNEHYHNTRSALSNISNNQNTIDGKLQPILRSDSIRPSMKRLTAESGPNSLVIECNRVQTISNNQQNFRRSNQISQSKLVDYREKQLKKLPQALQTKSISMLQGSKYLNFVPIVKKNSFQSFKQERRASPQKMDVNLFNSSFEPKKIYNYTQQFQRMKQLNLKTGLKQIAVDESEQLDYESTQKLDNLDGQYFELSGKIGQCKNTQSQNEQQMDLDIFSLQGLVQNNTLSMQDRILRKLTDELCLNSSRDPWMPIYQQTQASASKSNLCPQDSL